MQKTQKEQEYAPGLGGPNPESFWKASRRVHLLSPAPVPLVALVVSQENRRVDTRSSARPDGVWGEKNVPVVSHHGYVRARRTRLGWSSGAS